MTHREHTKTSQLLWSVKDNWRESTGHLGVQTNLDTSLDLEKNRREGLFLRWKVTNARTSKSHDKFQHLAETKIHLTKEICPQTNGLLTVNPAWSSKLSILCMWPYVTLLYFRPYFKGWVALWLEIECEGWINDHKRTKDKLILPCFHTWPASQEVPECWQLIPCSMSSNQSTQYSTCLQSLWRW